MKILLFFTVCIFCIQVYGDNLGSLVEVWACKDVTDKSGDVMLVAGVYEGKEYGEINVAGTSNLAVYDVHGFYRTWRYGYDDNDKADYAFIMEPNGVGSLFIYKGMTDEEIKEGEMPSYTVKCKRRI